MQRARHGTWRLLGLGVLLVTSAASATGFGVLGSANTATTTRPPSSVPGLAQVLGLVPSRTGVTSRRSSPRQSLPPPISRTAPAMRLALAVGASGTLDLGASNLVPGGSVTRTLIVNNAGNTPIQAVTLSPTLRIPLRHLEVVVSWASGILLDATLPLTAPLVVPVFLAPGQLATFNVTFRLALGATGQGQKGKVEWLITATA